MHVSAFPGCFSAQKHLSAGVSTCANVIPAVGGGANASGIAAVPQMDSHKRNEYPGEPAERKDGHSGARAVSIARSIWRRRRVAEE